MRQFPAIEARHDDNAGRPLPPIERAASAITAFVGRTLKGPVNEPVPIASFAEFQLVFGGLWQPSTLSYAVEQFFESGGQGAIIVRVANGGRAPSIALPADGGTLRLRGRCPGTREYLRGSACFSVNIALVTEGFPVFGLVHLPARKLSYWGMAGAGAWRDGEPIHARRVGETPAGLKVLLSPE